MQSAGMAALFSRMYNHPCHYWSNFFIVVVVSTQDPKGWSDVLTPHKLRGDCVIQGCDGKDAVCHT